MKKEDLLLVFEFLATALKQDVVEEKHVKSEKAINYDFNDYDYEVKKSEPEVTKTELEDKAGFHKSEPIPEQVVKPVDEPKIKSTSNSLEDFKKIREETKVLDTDNKTVKVIKTEAVRIKEIMEMIDNGKIYPYKKKTTPAEDSIAKALREHQQSIASQLSALESKLRDSIATPDQRRLFKEFVKMENFKAHRDLDRIGYFLDNPGVENPYEGKDEEPKSEAPIKVKTSEVGDLKIPVLDDLIKKSTVPQIIKDVMVKPTVTEIKPPIRHRLYDGNNGKMLFD
jgi:hypothetical protein